MSSKMLKFVEIGQQTPPKREVNNRKDDFNEIYDEFLKLIVNKYTTTILFLSRPGRHVVILILILHCSATSSYTASSS